MVFIEFGLCHGLARAMVKGQSSVSRRKGRCFATTLVRAYKRINVQSNTFLKTNDMQSQQCPQSRIKGTATFDTAHASHRSHVKCIWWHISSYLRGTCAHVVKAHGSKTATIFFAVFNAMVEHAEKQQRFAPLKRQNKQLHF